MKLTQHLMTLIAAAALLLTPAVAQQTPAPEQTEGRAAHGWRHRNPERMLERMSVVLELTETQKQAAKTIFAQARSESEPVATQLKQVRESLGEAVKTNNTAQINQLSERQGVLMGQLTAIHSKARAQFHAQLTPEQQQKAETLRGRHGKAGRF